MKPFRFQIWQGTPQALLEVTAIHILNIAFADNTFVQSTHKATLLLLISLAWDRLYQLLNKLYFYFTTLISSWTDKKQRHKSTIPTIVLSCIFFPVVFAVIATSAALATPLLPFFTLPIFLIGFPRPIRSWPAAVGSSANKNADTVYYEQLAQQLAKPLRTGFANGSLGKFPRLIR